jgi:nucleotide-binding universal stress UspA family protein
MSYKTLLVHLKLGADNEGLLRITGDLAERFGATVIGVAVCQPIPSIYPAMQTAYGNGIACEDITETDRKVTENRFGEMEAKFRSTLKNRAAGLEWRSTITKNSRSAYVARQLRAADLLITSPVFDTRQPDQSQTLSIGDVVLRAGRPVLLIPPGASEIKFDCAMVAWKNTREACRAVSDALPLLKLAARTMVAELAPAAEMADSKRHVGDVVAWLKRHGVSADGRIDAVKGVEAFQLDAVAEECHAGLIVAGAYGHTRLREWVIGSVTLDFLLHPKRPTLVSH